jgi:hypothetical protein
MKPIVDVNPLFEVDEAHDKFVFCNTHCHFELTRPLHKARCYIEPSKMRTTVLCEGMEFQLNFLHNAHFLSDFFWVQY